MAYPEGAIPLSGQIGTTAITDTFATHSEKLGRGGYRSVQSETERNSITEDRRSFGMLVTVIDDGITYQLKPDSLGGTSANLTDNGNWLPFVSTNGSLIILSDTEPIGSPNGSLWINTEDWTAFVRFSDFWIEFPGGSGSGSGSSADWITISATAPSPVQEGHLWINSTEWEASLYYQNVWVQFPSSGGGGGGQEWVTLSETPPVSPQQGRIWINTSTWQGYVRYGAIWLAFPSSGGGIPDAPVNGKPHGRQDSEWVEVITVSQAEIIIQNTINNILDSTIQNIVDQSIADFSTSLELTQIITDTVNGMSIGGGDVYKASNNAFTEDNSFAKAPTSGAKASESTELVRFDQMTEFADQLGYGSSMVISSDLRITSPTAGFVDAEWINAIAVRREVINSPVVFTGLPSTGNFRYDIIQGAADGTISVKTGVPSTTSAVLPSADAGELFLIGILWDSLGNREIIPPNPVKNQIDFPATRYSTRVSANTTGKYAKIWQGSVSDRNNYQLIVHFGNPVNAVTDTFGATGTLMVNFTCDTDKSILTDTVRIETLGNSPEVGEFVLVQLSVGTVCILHKSSHYWGRIQYSFPFFNSSIKSKDFLNAQSYLAKPSGTSWNSVKQAGGGGGSGLEEPELLETNVVKFDNLNGFIIGNASARTGNITFSFTEEKLFSVTRMIHNSGTVPTFPSEGVIIRGSYVTGVNNYIWFCLTKKTTGRIVEITIGQES